MRIAVLGTGSSARALPAHFAEPAPGVRAELVDPRLSVFALTPYERLVADLGFVDAAQSAGADGYDAVLIHSFADYGIAASRAVLSIPVAGAGEAALLAASADGRRFAIVTVWPMSMAHLYDERLRTLGLVDRCAAIRHVSGEDELERVGRSDGVMERMQRGDRDLLSRLVEACDKAMRDDGAEAVVLGCTCMAPVWDVMVRASPLPVVDCSRAGLEAAIAAARRGGAAATVQSGRRELVPALVDAWQESRGAVCAMPDEGSDCPVCIET